MICRGAATALIACSGAAFADLELADPKPANAEPTSSGTKITSLPQWLLRAQRRLALEPIQQRELRQLVDGNSERLREMQARQADRSATGSLGAQREEMAALQQQFRDALGGILSAGQLSEWDVLIEELLGQVHLRNAPRLVDSAQ